MLVLVADLEIIEEDMIEAFRSVLMLLPSQPSNPLYSEFLDQSRDFSYKPPFNAPKPPYRGLKLQVVDQQLFYIYLATLLKKISKFEQSNVCNSLKVLTTLCLMDMQCSQQQKIIN